MIIDCHCHAGKGDGLTGPWDTAAPLGKYLRVGGCVRDHAHGSLRRVPLRLRRRQSRGRAHRGEEPCPVHRLRVRPSGSRPRARAPRSCATAVEQYGFRGIKVHRHDGRITREICDAARAFGVPVLYDVMGEVSVVAPPGRRVPRRGLHHSAPGELRRRLARAGGADPDARPTPERLHRHSGIRRFELLQEALERAGPRKLLFGSDGPWLHPGVELEKVRALRSARRTANGSCWAATSCG